MSRLPLLLILFAGCWAPLGPDATEDEPLAESPAAEPDSPARAAPRPAASPRSIAAPCEDILGRSERWTTALERVRESAESAPPGDLGWVPDDVGGGELRAVRDGRAVALPLLHTDIDARITGPVADVLVSQVFHNPLDEPIEATYLFPLPENGAVDDLLLEVGDRTIAGRVRPRAEAQAIYEDARDEGKVAGLLTQERPDVFTQAVANIPPGGEVVVSVHVVQPLDRDGDTITWAFPTVVGPRYFPSGAREDDREGLTSPESAPVSATRTGNDIDLFVSLDAGHAVRALRSPTHVVDVVEQHGGEGWAELVQQAVIPNRDFVLTWEVAGRDVEAGVFTERDPGGPGHVLVTVQPPRTDAVDAADAQPKEMVFVVDTSGSMRGAPLESAKVLMRHAVDSLGPRDTFRIIDFATGTGELSDAPLVATPANRARALAHLAAFYGSGGTEILPGLRAALDPPAVPGRRRVVSFLTDGWIGNEEAVYRELQRRLGDARLHPVGIGSAPNRALLERMARHGRGHASYLDGVAPAEEVAARFYERIRAPLWTDIEVEWSGVELLDLGPDPVPDLYSGEPLLLLGRYDAPGRGEIVLRGRRGGEEEVMVVPLDLPARSDGPVASLWGRARIEELTDRRVSEGSTAELVDAITEVAVEYRLMSDYTAFVAVEEGVRSGAGGCLRRIPVGRELPAGGSWGGVFGSGMHGSGVGGGGYGRGSGYGLGTLGVSARGSGASAAEADPVPTVSSPIVLGSMDPGSIRRVVNQLLPRIRHCYERGLQLHPTLEGKVTVRFVIGATGAVTEATSAASTLGSPKVEACIARILGGAVFPPPTGGGVVVVNFPFVFASDAVVEEPAVGPSTQPEVVVDVLSGDVDTELLASHLRRAIRNALEAPAKGEGTWTLRVDLGGSGGVDSVVLEDDQLGDPRAWAAVEAASPDMRLGPTEDGRGARVRVVVGF